MFATPLEILSRETAAPQLLCYPMRPLKNAKLELKSEFLERHDWQPKVNDWRLMIHRPTGTMWNRHGDTLTVAPKFHAAFAQLDVQLPKDDEFKWLDCLGMGRRTKLGAWSLYLLDLPNHPGMFHERNHLIQQYVETHRYDERPASEHAYCLQTWENPTIPEMLKLQAELKLLNHEYGEELFEGLVAKRAMSTYKKQLRDPDKGSPDWLRFRWRF
jgi:hypothetical protein